MSLRASERAARTGDPARALDYAQRAVKDFQQANRPHDRAVAIGQIANILEARGELDEALRIRREEELPVYEAMGGKRLRAVIMGKIAQIFEAKGAFDEALRIHIEECLPVAQALADIDSIAHIRYSCAMLRIKMDGLAKGEIQTIHTELTEAFAIAQKLGRVDFIGPIGTAHAQILAQGGQKPTALEVLAAAKAAFEKLDQKHGIAQCDALEAQIRSMGD